MAIFGLKFLSWQKGPRRIPSLLTPYELSRWVQRAICTADIINVSLSIDHREAILFKVEPKLANLALTEASKETHGLLFADSFVKDLDPYIGAFYGP